MFYFVILVNEKYIVYWCTRLCFVGILLVFSYSNLIISSGFRYCIWSQYPRSQHSHNNNSKSSLYPLYLSILYVGHHIESVSVGLSECAWDPAAAAPSVSGETELGCLYIYIVIYSILVSISGLWPPRPGYQAWVHTVVWFGQNCVPRPGGSKTRYRYCIQHNTT